MQQLTKSDFFAPPGFILSVESNQNVESKTKNVESKTEKCEVQISILTSRNQLFWALNSSQVSWFSGKLLKLLPPDVRF